MEAEAHLSAALASPNDPSIAKYRQILADALTMARSQIGELTIQGNPPGADVIVNGHSVGTLPLPSPIKLPARNTEIVVRAPGYSDQREIMPIAGGQRHSLTVNLKSTEKPAAPAPTVVVPPRRPPPPRLPAPQRPRRPRRPSSSERSGSGAASGSGVRTAAWIVAGRRRRWPQAPAWRCSSPPSKTRLQRAATHGRPLDDTGCRTATAPGSYRRWSIVGYVSGGALAVTSAILFLTSRPTSADTTAHAHFQCAPDRDRHRVPRRLLTRAPTAARDP